MDGILNNIWVRRLLSIFNFLYVAVLILLSYSTFLYDLVIHPKSKGLFFTVYVLASVIFLGLMIFTRKQVATKIIAFLLLPIVLAIILFNMGDWILIIPPFVVAVVVFFVTDNNETAKVIIGTMYLLLYVAGIAMIYVFSLFNTATETRLDEFLSKKSDVYKVYDMVSVLEQVQDSNSISPDGTLKFYLYDVQDNNKGELKLIVEPYGQDKVMKFFTLKQKGIRRVVYRFEGRGEIPEIKWKDNSNIQFKLSGDEEYKTSYVSLPEKNYFEFLGLA
ncbi:MAG: hypothetical protein E7509_00640 [Ruminococcus sp.]|nr:hypothetical protein [Ruminococcus sp.]